MKGTSLFNFLTSMANTGLGLKGFAQVLKQIKAQHWLIQGRSLKYIDLTFDLRTMDFFRIKFRGFAGEHSHKEFHTSDNHEDKTVKKSDTLLSRITKWLKEGESDAVHSKKR